MASLSIAVTVSESLTSSNFIRINDSILELVASTSVRLVAVYLHNNASFVNYFIDWPFLQWGPRGVACRFPKTGCERPNRSSSMLDGKLRVWSNEEI